MEGRLEGLHRQFQTAPQGPFFPSPSAKKHSRLSARQREFCSRNESDVSVSIKGYQGRRPWLVGLYTEDALFYGGRPGHAVGHAKVREYFDSYVGTLAGARLALVDQELRKLGEGVYLAQGYAVFDFDLTAGGVTHTPCCGRRWF